MVEKYKKWEKNTEYNKVNSFQKGVRKGCKSCTCVSFWRSHKKQQKSQMCSQVFMHILQEGFLRPRSLWSVLLSPHRDRNTFLQLSRTPTTKPTNCPPPAWPETANQIPAGTQEDKRLEEHCGSGGKWGEPVRNVSVWIQSWSSDLGHVWPTRRVSWKHTAGSIRFNSSVTSKFSPDPSIALLSPSGNELQRPDH